MITKAKKAKKAKKIKHVPMSGHSLHVIYTSNGDMFHVNFKPTKKDLAEIYMTQYGASKEEAKAAVKNENLWDTDITAEKLKIYGHEICNMEI